MKDVTYTSPRSQNEMINVFDVTSILMIQEKHIV